MVAKAGSTTITRYASLPYPLSTEADIFLQWQTGRRGQDGWGKYTRRRKWYRDAELVEVTASTEVTPSVTPTHSTTASIIPNESPPKYTETVADDSASTKSSGFRPGAPRRSNTSGKNSVDIPSEDEGLPGHKPIRERESEWGIGDDARMGLE